MPIPDFVVELRRMVGTTRLWLPGVTAVVRRDDPAASGDPGDPAGTQLLLVRRADDGTWSPVTGILEPGEDPAVGARREAREEACVDISVDRLACVGAGEQVTHANGDLAVYLDLTFACTWVSGEAAVGDDESTDVRWFAAHDLPPMRPVLLERIAAAGSAEERARFVRD